MKKSEVISIVLIIALASLLSGLEARTPLGKWKLLYVFIIPLAGLIIATTSPANIRISFGLCLIVLFYFLSTIPALWESSDVLYNTKRSIQLLMIVSFCLVLCNVNIASFTRYHYFLAVAIIAFIVAFNIAWHITHGYYTGWKRLGDPKTAFLFLPMCLAAGIVLQSIADNKEWRSVWGVLFALVLLSGERKAFVSFCLLSIVTYINFRNLTSLVVAAGVAVLAFAALDSLTDGYTAKQLSSIFAGPDPRNELWYILEGGIPASLSDAARHSSDRVAWQLFSGSPIFGAGLDATPRYHAVYLADAPEYMRAAVHNEFLRVLAEHGYFGLIFFLLPLFRTAILGFYDSVWFYRNFNNNFYLRLFLIIIIPSLTYIWSEGSGTEMIALIVIVALLPDVLPRIAIRSPIAISIRPAVPQSGVLRPRP
jgi:hypothetical protein